MDLGIIAIRVRVIIAICIVLLLAGLLTVAWNLGTRSPFHADDSVRGSPHHDISTSQSGDTSTDDLLLPATRMATSQSFDPSRSWVTSADTSNEQEAANAPSHRVLTVLSFISRLGDISAASTIVLALVLWLTIASVSQTTARKPARCALPR